MTLTGQTRFRTGFLGKLILQVEETYVKIYDCGGSGYYDYSTIKQWRDAKIEDLTTLQLPLTSE